MVVSSIMATARPDLDPSLGGGGARSCRHQIAQQQYLQAQVMLDAPLADEETARGSTD